MIRRPSFQKFACLQCHDNQGRLGRSEYSKGRQPWKWNWISPVNDTLRSTSAFDVQQWQRLHVMHTLPRGSTIKRTKNVPSFQWGAPRDSRLPFTNNVIGLIRKQIMFRISRGCSISFVNGNKQACFYNHRRLGHWFS